MPSKKNQLLHLGISMRFRLLSTLFGLVIFFAACGGGGGESGPTAGSSGTPLSGSSSASTIAVTGQTTTYATGDDGDIHAGVAVSAATRFTDNGDGTITDTMTGLMWMQNVDCFVGSTVDFNSPTNIESRSDVETLCLDKDGAGIDIGWDCSDLDQGDQGVGVVAEANWPGDGRVHYDTAETFVTNQNGNIVNCGSSTRYIDWRMPTVRELESVINIENSAPAVVAGHPFTNIPPWGGADVGSGYIRTTTPWANGSSTSAWLVELYTGAVWVGMKTSATDGVGEYSVWLVRSDTLH